jgi:hypothetical protein
MTIDELLDAGFPRENWPEDLPEPGEGNISSTAGEGAHRLYRYEATVDGQVYAMEVVLDTATVPNAAEGVSFMLNQFAYLWRMNKPQIVSGADGTCRRINF